MKQRKIPLRRCTGCLEMIDKKELIRVVKTESEDGVAFMLDFTGKKSGRGAYICPSVECLDQAVKKRGLERSFRCPVPANVYEELRTSLANGP